MIALEQDTVRVTADPTGLSADHRVVWARLARLEVLCADRIARAVTLRTTTTTI